MHPDSGRRKVAYFPNGRLLQSEETTALNVVPGDAPLERVLLIEYLHQIQDREGGLPAGHLENGRNEVKLVLKRRLYSQMLKAPRRGMPQV